MIKEEIRENLDKGWILSNLWFEVMAIDRKITEKSLKEHMRKLKKTDDTILVSKKFDKVQKVKDPTPTVKSAYSQIVETRVLTKNIEALLFIVMAFAPSSIEIIEPKELKVGIDTLQGIMNSVADMMHRFAAMGVGGVVVSAKA